MLSLESFYLKVKLALHTPGWLYFTHSFRYLLSIGSLHISYRRIIPYNLHIVVEALKTRSNKSNAGRVIRRVPKGIMVNVSRAQNQVMVVHTKLLSVYVVNATYHLGRCKTIGLRKKTLS